MNSTTDLRRTRTHQNLTDTRVKAIKVRATLHRVWDSNVPGFHLQVTPGGSKSFRIQFQRPDGRKVSVTIGSASAWTVEAAREKARELRRLHEEGRDARATVLAERQCCDLDRLAQVWREDYAPRLKDSTRKSYESILKTTILPALGNRLVKDLVYEDVKALYRRTARATPIQANRAVAVLSKLFTVAEKEGLRPDRTNPCHKLERARERPRDRVFSIEDLETLELGLRALTKAKKLEAGHADLVRFLALSGLRRGEALGLKWKDVNLDQGWMTFEEHKTDREGTKKLPLNSRLRAVLADRAAERISPYVFPGRTLDKPFNGFGKVWLRIQAFAGLDGLTPHDFRHTFQTTCMELGYPAAIADSLLGHSLGRIRDTYTNFGTDGILAMASQAAADWIAAALAGAQPKPGIKFQSIQDSYLTR